MTTPDRRDLLPECHEGTIPLDAFQRDWCARCLSLECTRSIAGKSRFEQRVSTWEDRLFLNPPRMEPDDPRFQQISAKRFITIDVGRTPEIRSAWTDPRDLEEPQNPTPPVATKTEPVASSETRTASIPNDLASNRSAPIPVQLALGNAPDQSGKTLPIPPSASIPKRDPWAAPETNDPTEQIISPGATVKLRGSGV